jgi:hypothetical protein
MVVVLIHVCCHEDVSLRGFNVLRSSHFVILELGRDLVPDVLMSAQYVATISTLADRKFQAEPERHPLYQIPKVSSVTDAETYLENLFSKLADYKLYASPRRTTKPSIHIPAI